MMFTWADTLWQNARAWRGQRIPRWLVTGTLLVASVGFLVGMLWYYWPELEVNSRDVQLWPLGLAFVFYSLDLLVAVFAWNLIMRWFAHAPGFRAHWRIYCLTLAAGLLPGAPWHIAGRAVLYKQLEIARRTTGVAAALEGVLIIISGLWLGLLNLPFLPGASRAQLIWLLLLSIPVLALLHPAVIQWILGRLGQPTDTIGFRYRDTLALLALYLVVWVIGGCILYSVTLAFYPLPVNQLPAVIGVWGLAGSASMLAFFSPTSLGLKEVALSLLLALYVPAGLAVVIAIAMRIFQTAAILIWAIVASRV